MVDVSADLTNNQSHFEQILFQRGKIVVDGELNEIGRIARVRDYRQSNVMLGMIGETESKPGLPVCTGIQIVPGVNPGEVIVQPIPSKVATILLRGYVFQLTSSITLSEVNINPVVDEYYQVYVVISETEISSVDDSTIKIPKLEETTRRIKIDVTFKLGNANTDSAGFDNTASEPYESLVYKKSGILGYVKRLALQNGAVQNYQIHYSFIPSQDVINFRNSNIFLTRASTLTRSYVKWNSSTGVLTISNIAMVVSNMWSDETAAPIQIQLPDSATLTDFGDALVIYVPSYKRYAGPLDPPKLQAVLDSTKNPNELLARVENIGALKENFVNDLSTSDGLYNKYVFAIRLNNSTVLLRNGDLMTYTPSGSNIQIYEGRSKVIHNNSVIECYDKNDIAGYENDNTPFVHTRSVGFTKYHMIACFKEKNSINAIPVYTRIYISPDPESYGLVITSNARWLAQVIPLWVADEPVISSSILRFGRFELLGTDEGRITYSNRNPGAPVSWADDQWDMDGTGIYNAFSHLTITPKGTITSKDNVEAIISSFRNLQLTGTGDPNTSGYFSSKNTLAGVNIPKFHGIVQCINGALVVLEGFGITSVAIVGINIRVTLAFAFTDTNFNVQLTPRGDVYQVGYNPVTTAIFDIKAKTALGVDIDFSAAGTYRVAFVVHGRQ